MQAKCRCKIKNMKLMTNPPESNANAGRGAKEQENVIRAHVRVSSELLIVCTSYTNPSRTLSYLTAPISTKSSTQLNMAANSVALILGYGPGVGAAVAKKLASNGYKVAVASRSGKTSAEGFLSLKADFSNPDSIPALFTSVKDEFKAAPSVVVYNAATLTPPPDTSSIFTTPKEAIVSDLNINTISAYVAAQQAVSGWESLPKEAKKTFIYTGNMLNTAPLPSPTLMTLGIGKSASASWIGLADTLYASKGFRFFYADERTETGAPVGSAVDGDAHAEFYAQLANHEGDVPWSATFVKGKNYAKF
ncbi:hypothetical protein EJ04DRAFT_494011 [Polyplosphaeria fusca]|uniref:NAD(P)-binding protein n=1 Tax=Polyplosphaeria fusca TaxID=682080 RepID=A0A9P4V110_9PLEO|nr:hypothetical protein EJ04DRAFT_494011 [Polyplosphaeria fusca]